MDKGRSFGGEANSCPLVREALSARADGEPGGVPDSLVDAHVATCEACRQFASELSALVRATRLRVLAPAPDLSGQILAALGGPPPDRSGAALLDRFFAHLRHPRWSRTTQWVVAFAPLGVALPTLALGVFGHPHMLPSHVLTPCTAELARHLRHH
jgi:hypothetical protein